MTIDTTAICNTLEMLEDVRVGLIARLNVAEDAANDPALEDCWPLHRRTQPAITAATNTAGGPTRRLL
jgi:hypothetical protein